MNIHLMQNDGSYKCGSNVYISWKTNERKIMANMYKPTSTEIEKVTCKRCLNKVNRPTVLPITENYVGKIFHYSFGYDMTLNVYAKCIAQTDKSLTLQECHANVKDDDGRGNGRAIAGDIDSESKPFRVILYEKNYGDRKYSYWAGGRAARRWTLWDGIANYHNSWD